MLVPQTKGFLKILMRLKRRHGREMTLWKPILGSTYGKYCYICQNSDYDALTVDHVTPVYAGGPNELYNLRLCCKACNTHKSYVEVYMASLHYRKPTLLPTDKQLLGIRAAYRYFTKIVGRYKDNHGLRHTF